MHLIFLRHGAAVESEAWEQGDNSRPLTNAGHKQAKRVATLLEAHAPAVDVILSSPLTRAQETATHVAKRLGHPEGATIDARLGPGFAREKLAGILSDHPDAETLLLVGHEPDFSQTIGALTGGQVAMKKAGVALVEVPDRTLLEGTLLWLMPPKVL
jgi:phosphohistidine phosphatase